MSDSAAASPGELASPPGARRIGLLAVIAAAALLLDVLSKVAVVAWLEGEPPLRLLGGAVYLVVFRNSGAAFSLATGLTWLLTLIAIGVVVAIVRVAGKLRSTAWAVALGLLLGGALGNLVDRIFRAPGPLRGHVVDWISVFSPDGSFFPVFKVADSCITIGGVLLVLLALLGRELDGTRRPARSR
jgi:signal peptidase II